MRFSTPRCTLVIAGSWNVAIFSPGFVARNVFSGAETPQAEMTFGPEGLRPLYSGEGYQFSVQSNRAIWQPQAADDAMFQRVEDSALRLLGKLSVTPIRAVGVNFGFDADSPGGVLNGVLTLGDTEKIERSLGKPTSTVVKRSLNLDGIQLNFTISREEASGVMLDFNFHADVFEAKDFPAERAMERLRNWLVPSKRKALELLATWYGLELSAA